MVLDLLGALLLPKHLEFPVEPFAVLLANFVAPEFALANHRQLLVLRQKAPFLVEFVVRH